MVQSEDGTLACPECFDILSKISNLEKEFMRKFYKTKGNTKIKEIIESDGEEDLEKESQNDEWDENKIGKV